MSLADEFRAIRGGIKRDRDKTALSPEGSAPKPPWQGDIDRVQQTLEDVLQAISRLSGIELAGTEVNSQSVDDPAAHLDSKTLKDRIRNDLETFSISTVAEISKQAEGRVRLAMKAIQDEVGSQVDLVAEEFRKRLEGRFEPEQVGIHLTKQTRDQVADLVEARTEEFARWVWLVCKGTGTPIPMHIERLLEPYVEEVSVKFEGIIRQRVQDQLAQQKQFVQEQLQGTLSSTENQVGALEQRAQQICERNVDLVTKSSAERLNAAAEEAERSFVSRITAEAEESAGYFRARLGEMVTASEEQMRSEGDLQTEGFRQKLEGTAGEVQAMKLSEVASHIEQTAADVIESSVQHLHQQLNDAVGHSKEELKGFLDLQMEEVHGQVKELGRSVRESLSQDAARVAGSLKGLDQELADIRERHLAASQEQLTRMVQGSMESLTMHLKQITDVQMEEVAKMAQESQAKAASQYGSQLEVVTEGWYRKLLERLQTQAGEAGTKAAAEIKLNSESVMQELSDRVDASASVLKEEGVQASARIQESLQSSLEACKQQLAQISEASLEAHRQAISDSLSTLKGRLERSVQILRGEVGEDVKTAL